MQKSIQLLSIAAAGLAACLASTSVFAQAAGTWSARGGATRITPQVDSGTLSAPSPKGTTTSVGADTQPTGGVTYMWTDNIALDAPLGLGFKHKLFGEGALAGVGQIGTTSVLPATLDVQYRFGEAKAQFRPYVKLGLTYAYFFESEGSAALNSMNPLNPVGGNTSLETKSKLALSPGLGLVFAFGDKYFADVSVGKTFLKTTTTFSTGQKLDITLNPVAVSLGVGVRF